MSGPYDQPRPEDRPPSADRDAQVVLTALRQDGLKVTVSPPTGRESQDGTTEHVVALTAQDPETGQEFDAQGEDLFIAAIRLAEQVGLDPVDLQRRLGWSDRHPMLLHKEGRSRHKWAWILSFLIVAVLLAVVKGCLQGRGPLAPLFGG